jgi:hypothetical protein
MTSWTEAVELYRHEQQAARNRKARRDKQLWSDMQDFAKSIARHELAEREDEFYKERGH